MTSIRLAALVVALGVSSLPLRNATADAVSNSPADAAPIRNKTHATCTTDAGSTYEIPPGVHLSAELWLKMDTETRRLQELEVRLAAENDSLRASLDSQSHTAGVILGVIAGIGLGALVF